MKKILLISGGILFLAGAVIVISGRIPVARVNGTILWYRDVSSYRQAFDVFRGNLAAANAGEDAPESFKHIDEANAVQSILEDLITRQILRDASVRLYGDAIEREGARRLSQALEGRDRARLAEAAQTLYGLSLDDFITIILEQQSSELVLREKIEEAGINYISWLDEERKKADVRVYFYDFFWSEGRLVSTQ